MIQDLIAAERRELAVVLGELGPAGWGSATLCAGWRVPEVVAHMTMPFRFSTGRFVREMVKSAGRFNRMADRLARQEAVELCAGCPGRLAAGQRRPPVAAARWRTGGCAEPRRHPRPRHHDRPRAGSPRAPGTAGGGSRRGQAEAGEVLGTDLTGVCLRADDLDWSYGTGTPLAGLAQDLLLVLCNRRLPAGRLRGEPSARFTTV